VPFSVVCFRVRGAPGSSPAEVDGLNERLMERVNASGEIYLSHTRLDGRYVIRLAIGHYRTSEKHVVRAWEIVRESTLGLRP
jgi:aromatic-L-amino-acid decarboxylase